MLSISTSWNHNPDLDMHLWLAGVKALGFNSIELGYALTAHQLEDIISSLKPLEIKVSSIHNFCPVPDDEPSTRHPSNHYRLSSLDTHERTKAVIWTKKTIDVARKVEAEVVIIHAGTLELDDDPSKRLIQLYKEGKNGTDEFKKYLHQLKKLREGKKGPYIEALRESLKEVVLYAHCHHIQIGLETRYYPLEIPNFEEIGFFLDIFGSMGMGYWHDVGHAEVNGRLGLVDHLDFLKKYHDRMIGMHIHGVQALRDHLAPFEGDMDLNKVLPFLKNGVLRVVESRFASPDQIKRAFPKLSE